MWHQQKISIIEGFHYMWRHIKPILQVIALATAMLVSSLHGAVLENRTKCPVTFYLLHTIIPNYNWVTRVLAHTLSCSFNSFYEVNQKLKRFLLFFSIRPIEKGNQGGGGQNHARMGPYHIVQTLYYHICVKREQICNWVCSEQLLLPFHSPIDHHINKLRLPGLPRLCWLPSALSFQTSGNE